MPSWRSRLHPSGTNPAGKNVCCGERQKRPKRVSADFFFWLPHMSGLARACSLKMDLWDP
ncbi:hypothetical protein E2320_017871 [Naja naja]|nr:hypothetical protein E2320_017871 [Naja naja]